MSAFYRVPKMVFRDRGERTVTPAALDSVVLYVGRDWVYLHGAPRKEIHGRLKEVGAEMIADDWEGLKAKLSTTQKNRVFRKRVRRTVDGENVTLNVSRDDTDPSDVTEEDWIIPHKFLGE